MLVIIIIVVNELIFVTTIVGDVLLTAAVKDLVGLFHRAWLLLTELQGKPLVGLQDVVTLIPGPEQRCFRVWDDSFRFLDLIGFDIEAYDSGPPLDQRQPMLRSFVDGGLGNSDTTTAALDGVNLIEQPR